MNNLSHHKNSKDSQTQTFPTPHKPLSLFSSKKQRFTDKVLKSPGPGQYENRTTNFKLPDYHINKSKDSGIKREHQWIWGSSRGSYLENRSGSCIVGPGTYSASTNEVKTGKTNWGKSDRFSNAFVKSTNSQAIAPGPGDYQNSTKNKTNSACSAFKSKSPRSFIQKILAGNSTSTKKEERQKTVTNPEVSTQFQRKKSKVNFNEEMPTKVSQSSVFLSRIPRFEEMGKKKSSLGPGYYNLPDPHQQRSYDKLPRIITVRDDTKYKRIPKSTHVQSPGPGSYESNLKTIQKSVEQKGNAMIPSSIPRFQERLQENTIPGPGHYLRNKKNLPNELNKVKQSLQKPSFNSSSERSGLELPSQNNPLCSYNIGYYDLQYKMKKSMEHIDKLKIMEVTIPAFNSKSKR